MFDITSKLEINIRRGPTVATDVIGLGIIMVKNKIPAVVIDPEFIEPMFFERQRVNAQYKIITTVFNDKQYAMDKLRNIPRFCLESDGFEILVSSDRNPAESKNELKAITEFLRGSISPIIDIRWALDFRNKKYEDFQNSIINFKQYSCSLVRPCIQTTIPNFTVEKHQQDIDFIKKFYGGQIKLSGNIDLATIKKFSNITRFDVSPAQYKSIVKEIKEDGMAITKAMEAAKEKTTKEVAAQEVKKSAKKIKKTEETPIEATTQ